MEVADARPQQIAAAIDALSALPEQERQVYSTNARRAAEDFDFKKLTDKLLNIIESLPERKL